MSEELLAFAPETLEPPTAEQIEQHFSALDDSVNLIDGKVTDGAAEGETQTECNEAIDRNVRHIELMLEKDFIKDDGRSLTSYKNAVKSGEKFVAANGGLG